MGSYLHSLYLSLSFFCDIALNSLGVDKTATALGKGVVTSLFSNYFQGEDGEVGEGAVRAAVCNGASGGGAGLLQAAARGHQVAVGVEPNWKVIRTE